jgi:phenylacetate-CoA ligase
MTNTYQLSIIVPCYNEEGNLPELVARLQKVFDRKSIAGEIILVNDSSTDNTGKVIEELASQFQNISPVHHITNRGIVGGWKSGLEKARGDLVCLIDADLQNQPEDVWRLYRELVTTNVDIVQGYRSSVGRLQDSRYTLSKGLNFLLNLLFKMNLRDNKSGFVICRREVLAEILRYRFRYKYWQTFIMVAAKARGFTIREVETLFESRLVGKSFIPRFPLALIAGVFTDIMKAFYEYRISDKPQTAVGEFLKEKSNPGERNSMGGWRGLLFSVYVFSMPLHSWMISRNVRTYYRELTASQWLTPTEIKALQELKLRRLIHHAFYHVAYYRDIFLKNNLKPGDIQTIEDLLKLPLLDKPTIRENLYFDLLSDNHNKKKILRISTSGSTGEPFVCFADKFQLEMRWAATLRSMEWSGYRFGDRQARLWHQTIGMSWSQVIRERLDAWLSRRLFIPAYEMSDKNLHHWMRRLQKFRPSLIDGYAESFNFLAHYIKSHGLSGLQPKGIISSAQILPEQSRAVIENEFRCRVFDKYGSREFSGIAYESDGHDGHLVVAENYIVEILKDGKPAAPGEMGEVVITDLNNYCMPFIRYRVGDLAMAMDTSRPSPCGRGLPRIGGIEGRVQAIIVGTNGNYVPGTFFAHLFKDYDYLVKQYQVMQEKLNEITLTVVKGLRYNEEGFRDILQKLHRFLGSEMVINVRFVDSIPMVRTGKQQGTISKLNIDFQNIDEWYNRTTHNANRE